VRRRAGTGTSLRPRAPQSGSSRADETSGFACPPRDVPDSYIALPVKKVYITGPEELLNAVQKTTYAEKVLKEAPNLAPALPSKRRARTNVIVPVKEKIKPSLLLVRSFQAETNPNAAARPPPYSIIASVEPATRGPCPGPAPQFQGRSTHSGTRRTRRAAQLRRAETAHGRQSARDGNCSLCTTAPRNKTFTQYQLLIFPRKNSLQWPQHVHTLFHYSWKIPGQTEERINTKIQHRVTARVLLNTRGHDEAQRPHGP